MKKRYQQPEILIVSITAGDVMQGIIDNSPGHGKVDPDDPVDPDEPELTNTINLWDDGGEE